MNHRRKKMNRDGSRDVTISEMSLSVQVEFHIPHFQNHPTHCLCIPFYESISSLNNCFKSLVHTLHLQNSCIERCCKYSVLVTSLCQSERQVTLWRSQQSCLTNETERLCNAFVLSPQKLKICKQISTSQDVNEHLPQHFIIEPAWMSICASRATRNQ